MLSFMPQSLVNQFHHWSHHARQGMTRLADTHPATHLAVTSALAAVGMLALIAPIFGAAALTANLILETLAGNPWTMAQLPKWLALGALVISGLWIARLRFPEPEGVRIHKDSSPRLYSWVNEIRRELRAGPIDAIYLQQDFGVRVMRSPNGGLPLTFRNILVIGAPNLQCCSEQQLKAMVAGALGEVSLHNTGIVGWLSQLSSVWMQYQRVLAGQRHPLARLGHVFFSRYARIYAQLVAPLMNNRVLLRDQYAHLIVDDDVLAESIVMEVIVPNFLDDYYWPQVMRTATQTPEPTFKAFSNMGIVFGLRVNNQNPHRWIRRAFAMSPQDSHGPTLRQRLHAVGQHEAFLPELSSLKAVDELLGPDQRKLLSQLDEVWQQEKSEEWRSRFEQAESDRNRLQMLEERVMQGNIEGKQAMEYAALTKRYGTSEQAAEAYDRILAMNPEDPRINFGVGKYYLKQGDERGIPLLEKAMQMDKHCVPAACRLLSEHRMQVKNSEQKMPNAIEDWLKVV